MKRSELRLMSVGLSWEPTFWRRKVLLNIDLNNDLHTYADADAKLPCIVDRGRPLKGR